MITPTEHEKAEWSRMAQDCYQRNHNLTGHKYSVAAACCGIGQSMPVDRYDDLMNGYRLWLCFNQVV